MWPLSLIAASQFFLIKPFCHVNEFCRMKEFCRVKDGDDKGLAVLISKRLPVETH